MKGGEGKIFSILDFQTAKPAAFEKDRVDFLDKERVDNQQHRPHHEAMSDISRPEFEQSIKAFEAGMDARAARLEAKIEILAVQTKASVDKMELLTQQAVDAATSAAESAKSASNLKQTLWMTSITTVLAVLGIAFAAYYGTQSSNQSIVQTTLSAYQQGRSDLKESGEKAPVVTPKPSSSAK